MKRERVKVEVTDHAVLRFLEREHGLDVDAVRAYLSDAACPAAQIGAIGYQIGRVNLILKRTGRTATLVTAVPRNTRLSGNHSD